MKKLIRFALPALLAFGAQLPVAALAQDKAQPAAMNAAAAAAPLAYESAFSGYRADQDIQAVGWKESNERVTQPHDAHAGHDMGAMKHGNHGQAAPAAPAAKMHGTERAAQPRDAHAGHDMGAMKHGHHEQAAPAAKKTDPHQGHQHKE